MGASERGRGGPVLAVASVVAAVPALVAAVHVLRWGWVPVGDQATISTRAADVLTTSTPDLGQLSGASAQVGLPTRSPGPIGYWPFAVTARWGPLWGTAIVAAVVSGAAMVASVRLAARRGGSALALAVAGGLVLTARAINPANLASAWNPAIGVMPLVLLVLLAWSVADDEVHLLPVAVLVASFCAQVHAVLALPALLVLVIGTIPALRPGLGERLGGRRWPLIGAAVVGVVCWALPIHDQLTGDPGNLTRLARAGADEPLALASVLRVIVDVVGAVPAFLGGDARPEEHAHSVLLRSPSTLAVVVAVLVLAGLIALVVRGVRRRDRDLVVPAVLVLALLGAGVVTSRGTPGTQFLVLTYTTWWLVPVGMLGWAVLVWGWSRGRVPSIDDQRARIGAAVIGVVLVAIAVLAPAHPEPENRIYDEAREIGDRAADEVDAGRTYLVRARGSAAQELVAATAYRIRRAGARPVIEGNDGIAIGPRSVPDGRRCDGVVTITSRANALDVEVGPEGGRSC